MPRVCNIVEPTYNCNQVNEQTNSTENFKANGRGAQRWHAMAVAARMAVYVKRGIQAIRTYLYSSMERFLTDKEIHVRAMEERYIFPSFSVSTTLYHHLYLYRQC